MSKKTEQELTREAKHLGLMACCVAEAMEGQSCTITLHRGKSTLVVIGGEEKLTKELVVAAIRKDQKHLDIVAGELIKKGGDVTDKVYVKYLGGESLDSDWKPISEDGEGPESNLRNFSE